MRLQGRLPVGDRYIATLLGLATMANWLCFLVKDRIAATYGWEMGAVAWLLLIAIAIYTRFSWVHEMPEARVATGAIALLCAVVLVVIDSNASWQVYTMLYSAILATGMGIEEARRCERVYRQILEHNQQQK